MAKKREKKKERRGADEPLRESEERYRRLLELSPDTIANHSEGKIVFINAAGAKLLGASSPEQVIGKPIMDFLHPDYRDVVKERIGQIGEEGKEAPLIEEKFIRLDERLVDVEVAATPFTYQGKPAVLAIARDITERKRAEEALHRSLEETARGHRLLLALSEAAQTVQRARTPEEVYRTVGDEIARLGYQAVVFTLTKDRAHLAVSHLTFEAAVLRAAEKLAGLSAQNYRFPLVPGGFYERLIAEGETIFVEASAERMAEALPEPLRPLAQRLAALLGLEQSILAPLTVGDETIGLLTVNGEGLTEADVPAVSAFANQAAIAIENARLYEDEHRRTGELAALNSIAMTVTSTLNLQELLHAIQWRVMELLGEAYPPLFSLFNEEDQTFDVVLTLVQEGPVRRVEKLLGVEFGELTFSLSTLNPAVREALLAGKPLVASDGSDILGPRVSRRLVQRAQSAMGVKWIVDSPLWVKGKLVGTMILFSQKEKMPDEEMGLLSAIASQAAIAIEIAVI